MSVWPCNARQSPAAAAAPGPQGQIWLHLLPARFRTASQSPKTAVQITRIKQLHKASLETMVSLQMTGRPAHHYDVNRNVH